MAQPDGSAGSDDSFIGGLPDPEQMSNSESSSSSRSPSSEDRSGRSRSRAAASPAEQSTDQSANDADQSSSTGDSYPRVTELEKAILNQAYPTEELSKRLARMEKKAFGAASSSSDLGDRTDALQQYAETKLHKRLSSNAGAAADDDMSYFSDSPANAQSGGGADSSGASDYPRVDAIEKTILAQNFKDQPLDQRLSRMEAKAFGNASKSDDLSARTDALEQYAVKKLHMKPFEQSDADNAIAGGGTHPGGLSKKFLAVVANSLLGGLGGTPGGMGMNPFGYPGYGAFSAGNFGGIRVRPRSAVQPQQPQPPQKSPEQQAEEYYDEQVVHADTPPPPQARLITKVAWCEEQVFGHTFPQMHLTARLEQLNRELNFAPGKSSVDLMDDVAALMKSVQTRKQAGRSDSPAVH